MDLTRRTTSLALVSVVWLTACVLSWLADSTTAQSDGQIFNYRVLAAHSPFLSLAFNCGGTVMLWS